MTQANILVFDNLHEHREYHERVFTSFSDGERKRTDRGIVPFPTAVILDTCSAERDAVCEWRVDKIGGGGGVCMGVSDLNNEQISDDWAGVGKKNRVWYSICRGGWDAVGGLNNGPENVVDSFPAYKSGCVIRCELSENTLHFFNNGKPAGTLPITQREGTTGQLRFALQIWQARVTLVMASGLTASVPNSLQQGRKPSTPLALSAGIARSSSDAPSDKFITHRDRFRFQCNFQCVCKKTASWAKIGPAPGSPGEPAHPPYACCKACDATYLFMHAPPILSPTKSSAGRSTFATDKGGRCRSSNSARGEAIRQTTDRLHEGGSRRGQRRLEGTSETVIKDDVRAGGRKQGGRAMVMYCGREYAFDRAALHPITPQARGQQLESSLHSHWLSLKAAPAAAL